MLSRIYHPNVVQLIRKRETTIYFGPYRINLLLVLGLFFFPSVEISWQAVTFEHNLHGSVCWLKKPNIIQ